MTLDELAAVLEPLTGRAEAVRLCEALVRAAPGESVYIARLRGSEPIAARVYAVGAKPQQPRPSQAAHKADAGKDGAILDAHVRSDAFLRTAVICNQKVRERGKG